MTRRDFHRHRLAYELRQKGRDVPEFFIEGIEW